jgi:hypothetical protein
MAEDLQWHGCYSLKLYQFWQVFTSVLCIPLLEIAHSGGEQLDWDVLVVLQ